MKLGYRWRQRLSHYLRRDIYHVTDKGKWSFYWDAHYVAKGLREQHQQRVHIVHEAWQLRHQIIQFGDRYSYLRGSFRELHPSNHTFLTWFHGDLNDPNPDIQELFALLPEAVPYLEKIVISCQISRKALIQQHIPPHQLVTIPIGVDLAQFVPPGLAIRQQRRAHFGIPENALCIGSFQKDGRGWEGEGLEPKLIKGPDIFLETIAKLASHYPNLMIFLTGPARGYVKRGLEKIGVPYIHHQLDHYPDIVQCYQALDFYLITSRSEGGPKALLESWATGVPLISTRVGMPADLIRQGKNGWLAEIEDVAGLVEGTRALIETQTLQEQYRQAAFEDVKAYDWSKIADQYYALYQPFLR